MRLAGNAGPARTFGGLGETGFSALLRRNKSSRWRGRPCQTRM